MTLSEAMNITRQSFPEFTERVHNTIMKISSEPMDKTISSMTKRMQHTIKNREQGIKY